MVNVTKPVAKMRTQIHSAAKSVNRNRRLRNTKLNSSRRFGGFDYHPISEEELAFSDGISVEELQSFINDWKNQGYNVLGFLKSDDYAATGKDVLVETDDGVYIWDEGGDLIPVNSSKKRIQNSRKKCMNSSRRFGGFDYHPISEEELAFSDGISVEELQSFINDWKNQGYNVLGFLKSDDYAATGKDVLVETDDGVYIWDEGGDLIPVNSSKKLNSSENNEVAMITTESGNEVVLSDIKIVQNPDTNELALFVKENEEDKIPEGFVVVADAAQAALHAGNACPECGEDPCVCEGDQEIDSSKKKCMN